MGGDSYALADNQEKALVGLVADIRALAKMLGKQGRSLIVHITGHTDASGSEKTNLKLRGQRARAMAVYLESKGLSRVSMSVKGARHQDAGEGGDAGPANQGIRAVTFRVAIGKIASKGAAKR